MATENAQTFRTNCTSQTKNVQQNRLREASTNRQTSARRGASEPLPNGKVEAIVLLLAPSSPLDSLYIDIFNRVGHLNEFLVELAERSPDSLGHFPRRALSLEHMASKPLA